MRNERLGHDQELSVWKAGNQKWLRGGACELWKSHVDLSNLAPPSHGSSEKQGLSG